LDANVEARAKKAAQTRGKLRRREVCLELWEAEVFAIAALKRCVTLTNRLLLSFVDEEPMSSKSR
jgi:hypothetical protein